MELKITDWLAIYAAVVSTLVFWWTIKQSKAKIKVDILPGFETIDGIPTSGYFIIIRNISSQPIPIGSISILSQYKQATLFSRLNHLLKYRRFSQSEGWVYHSLSSYNIDTKCPITLEPRSFHKIIISFDKIDSLLKEDSLRLIKVNVQDQLWKGYFSKPIKAMHPSHTCA